MEVPSLLLLCAQPVLLTNNQAASGYFTRTDLQQTAADNCVWWRVSVGDVNNDGNLDAVFGNSHNSGVCMYHLLALGDGTGSFTEHRIYQTSTKWWTYKLKLADMNNDGCAQAAYPAPRASRLCPCCLRSPT